MKKLSLLPALLALGSLVTGCRSWSELETPKEKFEGASLAALLQCKNATKEEMSAAWDKYMPGKTGYTYLSSDKGKELLAIMKRWEGKDCNFDKDNLTEKDKARVKELIN